MEMGKDEERKEQQGAQQGGQSEDRRWEGQMVLHQLLRREAWGGMCPFATMAWSRGPECTSARAGAGADWHPVCTWAGSGRWHLLVPPEMAS